MEGSIFSRIRTKIEGYQKKHHEKELEKKERRRAEEMENLVRYPGFKHLVNCPKQSGIRTYVLAFGEAGFGSAYYAVRGTCRDCEVDEALY